MKTQESGTPAVSKSLLRTLGDRLTLALKSLTFRRADPLVVRRFLSGKVQISKWVLVLAALSVVLILALLKLEIDSFDNVLGLAKDQQALIERQQEIIEHFGTTPGSTLRDIPAY